MSTSVTHNIESDPARVQSAEARATPALRPAPLADPGKKPAVSVIIPTYNRVDLLRASIESVAAQTLTDYEIIVVDDGSEDDTRDYVTSLDLPIQYHWQLNQGVSEARNHALRVVRTEFVAFLDSDDLWKPRFLAETIARLRSRPDEAIVYTDFISTNSAGKVIGGHRKKPHAGNVTSELFKSTFIHTSAVVARAHIIRDAGGFDGRLTHNEDYDLWLRLSLRCRIGLVPKPLCLRRCHRNSLSRDGCSPEILLRKAELLERFYEEGGGKPVIAETVAKRRLAKVHYTAGKAFLRAGKVNQAREALCRSMSFQSGRIKTWFWYLCANLMPAKRSD